MWPENEGLAERNSHCTELAVVGRRQYWPQHLAGPVDEQMYCTLSELPWAWAFEPPGAGAFGQWSDTCFSLQGPVSAGFSGTQRPFLGSRVSPAHVLLEIHPLSSQNTQVVWPCSQLDLAWKLFLRVSPRVFYCLLKEESFPETPLKAKQLPA